MNESVSQNTKGKLHCIWHYTHGSYSDAYNNGKKEMKCENKNQ